MVIGCCMNKTAVFVAFILALLISATFTIGIGNSAPSYPVPTGPLTPLVISLKSPTSTTYVSKFVQLEFSVNGNWDGYVNHCSVEFSLDGHDRYVVYYLRFRVNEVAQNFSLTLGPLSEGIHQLQIFATVGGIYRTVENSATLEANDFTSQASVYFTVNTANQAQISILSPLNETYNVDKMIPLEFTVNKTESIVKMGYTLDEQANVTVPRNTTLYGPLSDGMHTLKVYSLFSDILPVSSTINFTVDTTAPNVSILSLQNKLYNSSKIPLVFTVNESTSIITYNMDGKVYTIDGNTTLTGLQNVDHKLIVYATDEAGNVGVSETIDFDVQVLLSPQSALPIIPPMIVVLVGGLSLLILIRKRNRASANKH
jgi:hypothetical protein